jgi:hypothetical protein
MAGMLITVVETAAFVARAKGRMSDEERRQAIDMIAADPGSGRLIEGGGGLGKIRFGIGGRGKRGGVRIIYYLHDPSVPVFLFSVVAKNERDDLTKAELNQLGKMAKQIARTYGGKP